MCYISTIYKLLYMLLFLSNYDNAKAINYNRSIGVEWKSLSLIPNSTIYYLTNYGKLVASLLHLKKHCLKSLLNSFQNLVVLWGKTFRFPLCLFPECFHVPNTTKKSLANWGLTKYITFGAGENSWIELKALKREGYNWNVSKYNFNNSSRCYWNIKYTC